MDCADYEKFERKVFLAQARDRISVQENPDLRTESFEHTFFPPQGDLDDDLLTLSRCNGRRLLKILGPPVGFSW